MYTELREFNKGVTFFEMLFEDEAEKNDVDMNMGYAVCLMNLNRREEAQQPLEYVYENDKNRWVAAALLGEFIGLKVLQMNCLVTLVVITGAIYLFQNKIEESVEVLGNAISHSNGRADDSVYYNYGYALLKLGRLEDALAQFEAALKKNPENNGAKEAIEIIKAELAERAKVEQEEQEIREKEQAKQIAEEKRQAEEQAKAAAEKAKEQGEQGGQSGEGSGKKGLVDDYFDKKKPNYRVTKGGEKKKPRRRIGTRIDVLTKQLQPQMSTKPYYRRKSLEVIPQGIAYEGAVSYAKWFNKQMAENSDDEGEA